MAEASRKGLVNSASFIDSHPGGQGSRSLHCLWALGCSPVADRRTCGHIEFYVRETGTHVNRKLGESARYGSYVRCGPVPGAQAGQGCQPQEELGPEVAGASHHAAWSCTSPFLLAPCLWGLLTAKVYSLTLCPPTGTQKV